MGKPRLLSTVTMLLQFFAAQAGQLLCMQRVAFAFFISTLYYTYAKSAAAVAATLDVASSSSSSGNNNNKAR